jgi:hypothetical protein
MRKITKLLSLAAFSIMSFGLHSFPVHADLIDTNGDGYPDFECAAPMSLPDGSVGCGDNSTSSSSEQSSSNSDSSNSNSSKPTCFGELKDCVEKSFDNPDVVDGFGDYSQCILQAIGCAKKTMSGE